MLDDVEVHFTVNDVMSKPVITVHVDDKIDKIAALMRSKKVGSVVVLDDDSKPVGVITERDIVGRVVSRNMKPSEVRAEEVMSKPIHTVDPGVNIADASKIMRNLGVRRLMVVKDSRLVGVVSSDDMIKVTPELITIIAQESSIGRIHPVPERAGLAGRCDSCDQWSNNLKEHEGLLLCEECLTERE